MIGHGGNARTLDKLASLGHSWPFMRSHVRSFIRHCPCCQKMSAVRIPIQLHHFASSTYNPFDTINMDFIGPFPDDSHVLVIIDTFSRWTELFWCPDATAASACRALLQHFGRLGAPNLIRSDRGPHFVNHVIKDFLAVVGTGHNQTLVYSKEENSIVERINNEINTDLDTLSLHDALPISQPPRHVGHSFNTSVALVPPTSYGRTVDPTS